MEVKPVYKSGFDYDETLKRLENVGDYCVFPFVGDVQTIRVQVNKRGKGLFAVNKTINGVRITRTSIEPEAATV